MKLTRISTWLQLFSSACSSCSSAGESLPAVNRAQSFWWGTDGVGGYRGLLQGGKQLVNPGDLLGSFAVRF
ncbi:hypothetical protein [Saccharospirillum impatiens]|uniref:hypothetical protein n=1 Tax=Saccharospirillum impatiens TaxID=169438 RepID=UPI00056D19C6|nr:hypothetical protein [Saccharospirillum impatiens]